MRGSGVHHLDLVVSSLDRSLELYRKLLAPVGYVRSATIVGERGERVVYLGGEGLAWVSLREAQTAPAGPYDRYAVGLHHLAFEAPSRAVVDDVLGLAHDLGLEIEDEPREWPYSEGYYAGFFHDPDGLKLEVVHVP